ncbi:MAG: hypothetical protein QG657_4116 [Acidobacteriota bacterium]|nr:hypothetical protein [Acidobacteriota bacterium]
MKHLFIICLVLALAFITAAANPKEETKKKEGIDSDTFKGLKFRSIGPAFTSGRISDFAVNPNNPSEYYAGVASGHIWKTVNAGISWEPVFDNYGAYAIGCLAMDPTNPKIVWAGTGENNFQRALGYGDGVYKTMDGGKTWTNMGLKNSRQIGMILIDPKNPDTVYAAAEGSAWGPGGDRGLFKTTDGGKTWNKILSISENTGVNSMVMDPRDPNVIIASAEQRRRHVHTKIGGGPESALYKTTDAGKTWRKLTSGLPTVDMGGIGLAISPVNPDVVYVIIDAADNQGGFFRSVDRGESWTKMSSHTEAGQYYNEIICDPKDVDKVYSVETYTYVTESAGKYWRKLGLKSRHVDDHALWIDPANTDHLIIGGDGGIYESFDSGKEWRFIPNLPVTQFYRVAVDNSLPFYYVYGGTQDNNSMGGPSQNTCAKGVGSDEWFVTNSGDGFWSQIDPKNPDIVYAEAQYGNMVRYDKKSQERISITPQPRKGEDTYRWNWDTPLLLSPHSHTRLYCAANKVFRSDDRGDSWQVISDDLTAKISRDTWPVMGKYWSANAVAKDVSTSLYGNIVALDESPLKENLLYIGTDDGLIQITENAGSQWRKVDSFPGVPQYTYVSDILSSRYDENIVYASFNNLKRDDFTPYLLKSSDKGKTWVSIAANLPKNGPVQTIAQDHVNPDLLFVGTEFGFFFTYNGGGEWIQLKAGLPTISVKDIAIQRRENDLVLATFGRGFYILDDYRALREFKPETLKKEMFLFPVKDALLYIQAPDKFTQGGNLYRAPNPPFGATFTYYLRDAYLTQKETRQKKEKELFDKSLPIPNPSWDDLRKESLEVPPYLLFTISDEAGNIIRELRKKPSKGINRLTWDLKYPSTRPIEMKEDKFNPFAKDQSGFLVMPGKYKVSIAKVINGVVTQLVGTTEFTVKVFENTTLPAPDREALVKFQAKVAELTRVVQGTVKLTEELLKKTTYIEQSLVNTPGGFKRFMDKAVDVQSRLNEIDFVLKGHKAKASWEEIPPGHYSIERRLQAIIYAQIRSTSKPSKNHLDSSTIVREEITPLLEKLRKIAEEDLRNLEKEMEQAGAPWTPGRIPELR